MSNLGDAIERYREAYAKLDRLQSLHGKDGEIQDFQMHFKYTDSIACSLIELSSDPKKHVVAIISLTRMLLESTAIMKSIILAKDLDEEEGRSFIKAYEGGDEYPEKLAKMVRKLGTNKKDRSTLNDVYAECCKVTHFSQKSLFFIENESEYKKALRWSTFVFELMALSFEKTLEELYSRLSENGKLLMGSYPLTTCKQGCTLRV